jgi:hypothetical protein
VGERGDVKGENYFSGFASLIFGLRGWGGVFNIRRKTSSGLRFGSSSLRGSFSLIGASALPLWKISDKESLVAWVSRFLWHYEMLCTDSGPEEVPDNPASIIVENIVKAMPVLKDGEKSEPILLPVPASYFQIQGNH